MVNTTERQSLTKLDVMPLLALFGLTILLFSRYLLSWPTPLIFPAPGFQYGTDLMRESWSIFRFTSDVFHQSGAFPLWRPYILSGAPLIGHPVAPVMYLPNWLTLILPLPLAFNILIIVHLWWAGVGTYLYLRLQAGLTSGAALIGALIFSFAPRLFTHIGGGHLPLIEAVAWWPWAWFFFSRYWDSKRLRWAVFLGISLAAHALTDGRYAAMTGVCLATCTLWQLWRGKLPALRSAVAAWLIAGAVAIGLSAVILGPFVELLAYTNRVDLTQAEITGGLEPAFLMNVFFRSTIVEPESYTFVGITVIILIILGISAKRSYPEKWWLLALFSTVLLSLGTNTPLPIYSLLLRYVPIFQFFRAPGRWYPYAIFAAAVLAAWGYEKWSTRQKFRLWLRPALVGLSLIYLGVAISALLIPLNLPFGYFPQAFLVPIVAFLVTQNAGQRQRILLMLVLIVDLWAVDIELVSSQSEQALINPDSTVSFLKSSITDDERVFAPYGHFSETAPVVYNLHMADGYDPFILRSYDAFMRRATNCTYQGFVVGAPPMRADALAAEQCAPFSPAPKLLSLLDIRYVLLPKAVDFPDSKLIFNDQGRWIYDIGQGYGRAFGVSRIEMSDEASCLDKLANVTDPSSVAVVESLAPQNTTGPKPTVLSHQFITDGEEFQVSGGGLLVRSEVWAPGWTVKIDDSEARIDRVDCTLQGIWLPSGTYTVRFEYRPRTFVIGATASLITLIGLIIYGAWLVVHDAYSRKRGHALSRRD